MSERHVSEYVQHERYIEGALDAHGNVIDSWAPPLAFGIYAFNPGGTTEPLIPGHQRVVTSPMIYVPSTELVAARDRFTVRGLLHEVDGDSLTYRNPFNAVVDGLAINLKRVTG